MNVSGLRCTVIVVPSCTAATDEVVCAAIKLISVSAFTLTS
jgi:hypothetical protein